MHLTKSNYGSEPSNYFDHIPITLNYSKDISEVTKSVLSDFNYLGETKFNIPADCKVFADYGLIKNFFSTY